jgi:hypothetical protein
VLARFEYSITTGILSLLTFSYWTIGTDTDAVTYLTRIVDRKILRVLKGQLPGIDLRSCFLQRALVRKAVPRNEEQMPQLVSHEDLDPSNIIIDAEYNIKG